MAAAALAFGSNLGDSRVMLQTALARLDATGGISLKQVSAFYRTPPWGVTDQPDFINACATVETGLSPEALLNVCKALETELGREQGERWGPRLIDIDILWMDGETRASETLTLPHPRMLERPFVLLPLAEIAPDLEIAGKPVRDHAASLALDARAHVTKAG